MWKLGKGAKGKMEALHKPGVCEAKHTKTGQIKRVQTGYGSRREFKALHKPGVYEAKHTRHDKQNVCKLGKGAEGK